MTGLNIRDESHILNQFFLGFLEEAMMPLLSILGYLSKLKYILKIEKSIYSHNNQSIKFNKFNFIYDNL